MSVICQPAPCCQHVVIICWLFFNFAVSFDFGCCSLAQEMRFVDHYLPYFSQQLINSLLSTLLPFQLLFTGSWCGDQLLASPCLQQWAHNTLPPLLCVSFQFLVYCSVFWVLFCFCRIGVSVPRGLCWFIPGVDVGILHDDWCSPVGLPNVSQAGWSQHLAAQEPSCFLSVTWHGEAFHGLGVQGVEILILLVLYFCQVWLQHLSIIFDLKNSHCLLLCPSHHLGSPQCFLYTT
jgi:hypothetical protein